MLAANGKRVPESGEASELARSTGMIKLRIHNEEGIRTIEVGKNSILLQVLRENGYEVYAPCGGEGTCGKCKVWLKGEGSVAACAYKITGPAEILLPDRRETRILVEQHSHTRSLPLVPGPAAGLSASPHGVAFDLGTTTLVFYLVNLVTGSVLETRSSVNPQARFGGDVITRIQYTAEKEGGVSELQDLVLDAINRQLDHFTGFTGISRTDIVRIVVAGNTTMLHLLLGVDPLPLAMSPFTPAFTDEQRLCGRDLSLHCHPEGEVKLLPSVSAYVGADILAGLASIEPSEAWKNYLYLDIGTNGELALVTPRGITCCSTAAGPAFEGARISCGMGGTQGAISAFDENGYTVIGDVRPAGICGSGLIDVVAYLLGNGKLDEEGFLEHDFTVVPGEETESGYPLTITRQDIREVQLAKSAIAAGLEVLLKHAELDVGLMDAVFLAGGFGNYIHPEAAMKIGLLPPSDRIVPLGNASGTGALLALKSTMFDRVLEDLLERMHYIELSGHEEFSTAFAMHMNFKTGS